MTPMFVHVGGLVGIDSFGEEEVRVLLPSAPRHQSLACHAKAPAIQRTVAHLKMFFLNFNVVTDST